MLAGAGRYIPEWAGKRSKYMQGRGGEASYGVSYLEVLLPAARMIVRLRTIQTSRRASTCWYPAAVLGFLPG